MNENLDFAKTENKKKEKEQFRGGTAPPKLEQLDTKLKEKLEDYASQEASKYISLKEQEILLESARIKEAYK